MPEYLSPGVYVEEVNSGPRPIEGVGTATAAFVGFAPGGPTNRPILVTNWSQYVEAFSQRIPLPLRPREDGTEQEQRFRLEPFMKGSYMAHSVYGFFINGGGRCYVTRVVPPETNGSARRRNADVPPLPIPSRGQANVPAFTVAPKGSPTGDIEIKIDGPAPPMPSPTAAADGAPPDAAVGDGAGEGGRPAAPASDPAVFTIHVTMAGATKSYENLTVGQTSRRARNVVEAVNQDQEGWITLTMPEGATGGTIAERTPVSDTWTISVPQELPQVQAGHLMGKVTERSGVAGLAIADDVNMICCPDVIAAVQSDDGSINAEGLQTIQQVQRAMIDHCEDMGDRVAILDTPPGLSPQEAREWRLGTQFDSKFAAMYYPWITVADQSDPTGKKRISLPPSGHIAGVYAATDNTRGVHKAPANEVIRGALEVETPITTGEQGILNPDPVGVNCIRSLPGQGIRVWGARTLSSDPAWRYVNVRRLFNYVEKSIERSLQWVVFEPNDPNLWARVHRDVTAFLTGVWRDGMLFGLTPGQAFFVKCDAENNPDDQIALGRLYIDVGLAPVKPAEFVIFRLSQWAGGGA